MLVAVKVVAMAVLPLLLLVVVVVLVVPPWEDAPDVPVVLLGRRMPETRVPLMFVSNVVFTSIPVGCLGGAVGTFAKPMRMGYPKMV